MFDPLTLEVSANPTQILVKNTCWICCDFEFNVSKANVINHPYIFIVYTAHKHGKMGDGGSYCFTVTLPRIIDAPWFISGSQGTNAMGSKPIGRTDSSYRGSIAVFLVYCLECRKHDLPNLTNSYESMVIKLGLPLCNTMYLFWTSPSFEAFSRCLIILSLQSSQQFPPLPDRDSSHPYLLNVRPPSYKLVYKPQ